MESLLVYLLKSAAILSIFYLLYWVLLRKDTSFQENRKFLAGGILASAVLPAITFTRTLYLELPGNPSNMLASNPEISAVESGFSPGIWEILGGIYFLVAAFFVIRLLYHLICISKLISSEVYTKQDALKFIETEKPLSPFSFFRYIIYNPELHTEKELQLILLHEKVHARQWHSLDNLLANLCCALLWFNPISWWYKKHIEQNLEYIADHRAVQVAGQRTEYQKALVKVSTGNFQPALSNQFYQSLIKKRIIMLNQKQNKNQIWKMSLIFPLLLAFLLSFNTKTEARILEKQAPQESKNQAQESNASEENSQNPEPLYILNGEKTTKEIVDLLDKEKIENVKVLKGADATALYGEEGRNGVVIITTKKTEKAQNTSEKVQKKLSVKKDTATSKAELKTEYKIVAVEYIVGDQDIPAFQRTDLSEKKKHLVGEAYKTNPQIIMGGPGQPSPLVVIDGKKETAEAMKALKPKNIKGIKVLKDEAAIEKYGEDALEGVIEITTRKQEEKE
ncbi:M56 family metallopeptidase [Salegentibacter sp. HM20]